MGSLVAGASDAFGKVVPFGNTIDPGAAVINKVFGGKKAGAPAAPPQPAPVVAMPDPLEQQKAKERSILEQMARRGRGASILTQPASSQTLGGG